MATADAESFSQAAATLNVKQLTRRVHQLEEQLGVKLFDRTTLGAEPTKNSWVVTEQACRIVTDINNLQTTARNVSYGMQGRIAVGYFVADVWQPQTCLHDYLTRFPDVQFDGIEATPEKLLHGLQVHTVDAAIAPIGLEEAGIKSGGLWSEQLMLVMLEHNRLLLEERIYWQDLRREIFVVPSGGLGPILRNLLSAKLTEQGYRPNMIYQDEIADAQASAIPMSASLKHNAHPDADCDSHH